MELLDVPPPVSAVELGAAMQTAELLGRRPLSVRVQEARLLGAAPPLRALGKLTLSVETQGWRFPTPIDLTASVPPAESRTPRLFDPDAPAKAKGDATRLRPPRETVLLKERLLYLLQPPLESLFAGKQVRLPCAPYPYQIEGIAFLMPRAAALLADEMGLGKAMQTIIALRLLFQSGLIRRALLVCPKPLVNNWSRELRSWAEDLPFEVIGGDAATRRASWLVSNCPLKLINYELLTRDAAFVADEQVQFDVVVLDEAQRIKNRDSKTAQVVRSLRRQRSWALTGTPIENKPEDLVKLFAFVDAGRI